MFTALLLYDNHIVLSHAENYPNWHLSDMY